MNKRHYEHTLPNIRGSLSNTYIPSVYCLSGENLKYHAAFLSSAYLEKYSRIWNENGNT